VQRIASGFGLLEGARWYLDSGLVFSDMTQGGVYHLAAGVEHPEVLIPYRKGIGGLVAHASGGFVVAGRNVAHKYPANPGTTTVLLAPAGDETFFNDLTADGNGNVFVGSVAHTPRVEESEKVGDAPKPAGRLYRIDVDGSVTVLADDVLTSNGLSVDPTNSVLYHVDSPRHAIWSYPVAGTGTRPRELFVDTSDYAGVPDGLAVREDGSVWVAMAGGGVVVAWDADGKHLAEIAVPQSLVTTLTFGGDDRRTVFILTGSEESGGEREGSVYTTASDVPGLAAPYARVTLG
jgi:xylono-1,5-lactonase